MSRYVKIKDYDSLVKDTKSKAVISTDDNAYKAAIQRKKSVKRIENLETDITELKEMMKVIIQKLDK